MEKTINEGKKKFTKTKVYFFMKKHKKPLIVFGVVFTVILTLTLVFTLSPNPLFDYSYAKKQYNERTLVEDKNTYEIATSTGYTPDDLKDYEGTKVYSLTTGDNVSYTFNQEKEGNYNIYFDYYVLHNGLSDSEFDLSLDGTVVLSRVKLRAKWKNSTEEFKLDKFGNEITPLQDKVETWQKSAVYDYSYSTPLPYSISVTKGAHTLTLTDTNATDILLGNCYFESSQEITSYEKYKSSYSSIDSGTRINAIEAEHFAYKNETDCIPANDADINVTPYDTYNNLLNVVDNFDTSSQMLSYEFDIENEGMYCINFNAKVDNSNHSTFATIFLDGKVPFGELLHYGFAPFGDIRDYILKNSNDEPYEIFLTKGHHSLTIKIDTSLYNDVIDNITQSVEALNKIYLNLKSIAGTVQDNNREWDSEKDFPGTIEELNVIVSSLLASKNALYKINGSNANFVASIYLQSVVNSLKGILKEPKKIPNKYASFNEGGSSIIQNLTSAKEDLLSTPLIIDRIIIGTKTSVAIENRRNGWDAFGQSWLKFFNTFFKDYSATSSKEKQIEIWVARSRQYVDLLQEMYDATDFEKDTGYSVRFSILSDEGKLILSNAAKISPNVVLGISNWLPYEMGIRDLTVNLREFSDYKDVMQRFSKGAFISLIADNKALALPETQDFYVTYYRKDILSSLGVSLPSTWEDVISLLPTLQRNGMNFYIPLSTSTASKSIMTTAPFIYQYGGNLFSDDGTTTTIDQENSLNAIKLMTEMFTLYGMESQVSNFFTSFRNGSLPIGVSTFDTYVKLSIAAPEISGKWDIALSPGTYDAASGEVLRYQTGSATSMTLLKSGDDEKDKAGWKFLKWWSSEKTQSEYAQKLALLYGKGYIWNSANLQAFNDSSIFTTTQKTTILKQWEYLREIPKVPGWYMLERELSNAWNNIVLKAKNTRAVIEDAVNVINKELQRKLVEFGYLDNNGNVIKPYTMTTLSLIENIIKNG